MAVESGQYTTTGTGPNKKMARNTAAEQMMATLPEEWKQVSSQAAISCPHSSFAYFQKAGKGKKRGGGASAKKRGNSGGFGSPPAKKKVKGFFALRKQF